MIHLGYTGTRFGMSALQWTRVHALAVDLTAGVPFTAHHGLCVGGDAEFHSIVRGLPLSHVVGHPGPNWPDGGLCARITDCDEVMEPAPHMRRNAAVVAAAKIMIGAPYEDEPQARGGTWRTIGMARRALKCGLLGSLHVVGRDGQLLDHGAWL